MANFVLRVLKNEVGSQSTMARTDLMRQLFESYSEHDNDAFVKVATLIIEEEEKKNHLAAAHQLKGALRASTKEEDSALYSRLSSGIPKDSERGMPLLEIRRPDKSLNDLIIDKDIEHHLRIAIRYYLSWDLLTANGVKPVRHMLFCGPPGCGKTSTAEAIAWELGLPLIYVRFDAVVSSLLGETAANLRKVFDFAQRGQWIVFFDEFDAIGRSRDDLSEHGEIKRVVSSFLQLVDSFSSRSLMISATNFEQSLDPAIWRRFDEVIRFEKPTMDQIEQIASRRLGRFIHTEDQILRIANNLDGYSHADVERICLDIARALVVEGTETMHDEHVELALKRWNHRRHVMAIVGDQATMRVSRM